MTPQQRFVATAIVGGIAGSLGMDIAQAAWSKVLERDRSPDVQDEETEAITSVVGYLTRFAPGVFPARGAKTIGHVIHYLFGIGFAAAYVYVLPNRKPASVRAATFGTLLWLLSDRILIPVFRLGRPWARYSMSERSNALVSHLVYAFGVEYARSIE